MKKCKLCGGSCVEISPNTYQCEWCGNTFSAEDFSSVKNTKVSSLSDVGTNVFEKNIHGVLEITWNDGQYLNSGSGFLINEDGYCITNTHVVTFENGQSCGSVTVKINDEKLTSRVVTLGDNQHGSGQGVDLALIKLPYVPKGATVMEFEDFNNVKVGETVYVIGNSLGQGTCMTSGIVSDKARNVNGKILLMTDCAVNGGNSGGSIFNKEGRVIGAIVSGIKKCRRYEFCYTF